MEREGGEDEDEGALPLSEIHEELDDDDLEGDGDGGAAGAGG